MREMVDDIMFFHFHNLQDDFINYYQSTNVILLNLIDNIQKLRIDQIKLSKMTILHGAYTLHRRIQSIFNNHVSKGIVLCAHLKHSKLHDFFIIAACLIYGYTLFHSNWHNERYLCKQNINIIREDILAYKLEVTKCSLVILDDELEPNFKIPHVKFLKISDVYTQSIYNKSRTLSKYLTLVDSMGNVKSKNNIVGKVKSDVRIQNMLASQTSSVSEIKMDDVVMISFTEGNSKNKPKAKKITFREMYEQFKHLEALNMWNKNDILVMFLTNPTYDWINCIGLYYSFYRPNVYVYFMQRYMSTYWKILWESNEHAKNVYLQLGKPYKIVNFIYPRQLEALFTLDEIIKQFPVNEEDPEEEKENNKLEYVTNKTNVEVSSDDKEAFDSADTGTNVKLAKSASKISSYFFGKKGILNNIRSYKSKDLNSLRKQTTKDVDKPTFTVPETNNTTDNSDLYIQKLHLKYSELYNVLSDNRVHFVLSGSNTDYNLSKMIMVNHFLAKAFAILFRGKVPIIVYGSSELSPFISIASCFDDTESFHKYSNLGCKNFYNDIHTYGYYIGNCRYKPLNLRVVRSISKDDDQFMVKCDEGEPGFIVCDVLDNKTMIYDRDLSDLFHNQTYLGLDDIGFYFKSQEDDEEHFYWSYTVNSTFQKDQVYPHMLLMGTSKLVQNSICRRFGLTTSVVKVETVKVNVLKKYSKVITVVELLTAQKSDIAHDIRTGFLETWKTLGLFKNYIEPDEIRVSQIPFTYKGSVNYPALIV
ncbi:uncharacterized protein TA08765 [Theileria annulata]|uniref:AMP-dependent synthetase/ligase domain-containing protein n=1 Tax=Theileria annulata TaxID=5874 RepID=Q4U9G7_THEAN|nr:uncharacterized protein TA08765 [Theileria annulata]CAI76536.1 hypothetical protein, conserved [Theileria annulata]|eukprot:XP_953161.1 hypothetical protein, conserved [Theileria annulata]